jgi:E3 ubiquitin-protein ligase NEDD4
VTEDSILAVQIFDQKKFKKKDQGFLGVINVRVGSVIDLEAGGDGKSTASVDLGNLRRDWKSREGAMGPWQD